MPNNPDVAQKAVPAATCLAFLKMSARRLVKVTDSVGVTVMSAVANMPHVSPDNADPPRAADTGTCHRAAHEWGRGI